MVISPKFCKLMSVFIDVYAITLYPFIISKERLSPITYNHESIHLVQQRELWLFGFYFLYIWYWLKNKASGMNSADSYYYIPFEREACENELEFEYIKNKRQPYAWKNYR